MAKTINGILFATAANMPIALCFSMLTQQMATNASKSFAEVSRSIMKLDTAMLTIVINTTIHKMASARRILVGNQIFK